MPRAVTLVILPKNAKPWKNGLLYVTPDAEFFRKVSNGFTEVKKIKKERKTGECWEVLYVDERKKWIGTLAHTVMAEVFVEKPEGAKTVSMKDGNYLNLSLDNITWSIGREYLRQRKRDEKKKGRLEKLPIDYKKVPNKNIYITIDGKVVKPEKNGGFSVVTPVIKHNNTTDVYVVSVYDYETKKSVTIGIHTLLAETFLAKEKGDKDTIVNFKDGNGLNISIDNLFWTTKVNPINPRKDIRERMSTTLPVECKYYDGVYVSAGGRIFTIRDNNYLELLHNDNGKSITVNIPDGNEENSKKNRYRIKKVSMLVANAYLQPRKEDEAEEPAFIDGNYRNVDVTNLIRRKLAYPPTSSKEKEYFLPDEEVFDCHFNNLYVSRTANVYVRNENGYRKISVTKVRKPSGNDAWMVSYFDLERKKYEIIVLKKLMAYAFLNYNGTDDVINVDTKYNHFALENLYVKPHGSRMVFLDHPARETYSEIPDGTVQYNNIYINEALDVYYKVGEAFLKLVKFVVSQKEKMQFIGCRYIDENGSVYVFDLCKAYDEAFNKRLCFNQKNKVIFLKSKSTRTSDKDHKVYRKRTEENYLEEIGEDFVQAKCNDSLWINREGVVYEFIPELGYKLLKISVMNKHGHPFAYVDFDKNEKGVFKHKGIDRLLAETFLWKEDSKCPHVIHKDGNPLNYSLDNLDLAGAEARQKAIRIAEKKANRNKKQVSSIIITEKKQDIEKQSQKKEKVEKFVYFPQIPDGYVEIPGKTYNGYFVNKEGKIYKFDLGKGYRIIEHSISEEGIAYIKVEGVIKPIGLILAKAFIPNPVNATNWEPINGDAKDISLSNIRWKANCCVVDALPNSVRPTYQKNIWVDLDESIYFLEEGVYKKIVNYTTTGKRLIVRIMGKTYFPSRLVAEALVYNPYGEDAFVTFINGDSKDIRCENLEWTTAEKLSSKNMKLIHKNSPVCPRCNEKRIFKGNEYCSKCQKQIDKENKLIDEVEFMRTANGLNESQIRLIDLYSEGKNLSEIAEIMGISRQAVHGKLNSIKRRANKSANKEIIDNQKLDVEIREKYKALKADVSFELYDKIYRLALKKENNPMIIAKRVVKRMDKHLENGHSIEEMVDIENQFLTYQRMMRNN